MTDQRIRDLERRWKESGTQEDEAALLRARIQAGQIGEERLRLAARCGSRAAASVSPEEAADLSDWTWVEAEDQETQVRLAIALSGLVRIRNRTRLLGHLERWVLAGCPVEGLLRQRASNAWLSVGASLCRRRQLRWQSIERIAQVVPLLAGLGASEGGNPAHGLLREVVPWCLGHRDPIRDRLEARQHEPRNE